MKSHTKKYLIINRINGYIEESNGNKYLTLVPPDFITHNSDYGDCYLIFNRTGSSTEKHLVIRLHYS